MTDNRNLFAPWFDEDETAADRVRILVERKTGREAVFEQLLTVTADHVIGLKVIEKLGGFSKAAHVLQNRLPKRKISRSGMLGEILATEYLNEETEYTVPIRRLQHRDTREQAMRGDDVLGFWVNRSRVRVVKVEAKSRAKLATAAIREARDGLANNDGRPNPETLAFVECILRQDDRDDEAEPVAQLQRQSIREEDVSHLLFTLSGNSPTNFLVSNSDTVVDGIELRLCGCRVGMHADFVKTVFDTCLAKGTANGNG